MAFSSIEEEDRKTVIEQCYWPLLNLAEAGYPIGIEATSFSLKVIHDLDPEWIKALKVLLAKGKVEFIGSGYVQMIAPLVPADVTLRNLTFGLHDYKELLGVTPKIALVNEQAYAPSLVPLYLDAGYEAIMMDWAEPASHHKNWERSFSHRPQIVDGLNDQKIPVLWSDAISFQKFQRYAHGELDAEEYFEFLSIQLEDGAVAFPLYTSDAEVFDYRPGRFVSEATRSLISEYERIRLLLAALTKSGDVQLGLPNEALQYLDKTRGPICLETASAPVPVKKQRKYNILRWAVSGRQDLLLNTYCWRLYEGLCNEKNVSKERWRQLCEFWASDFRTHITEKRWTKFIDALPLIKSSRKVKRTYSHNMPPKLEIHQDRRFLFIETPEVHLVLCLYRGLAIHAFGFGKYQGFQAGAPAENSLVGTLSHGFYSDIVFGADFYSGHLIFEPAGNHKATDLLRVEPALEWDETTETVKISCQMSSPWGNITKTVLLNVKETRLDVSYDGDIAFPLEGSFRLGHITLNPRAFDKEHLYYASHNGGEQADIHKLWRGQLIECDHGASVSRLISATTGLGMTKGTLELGDLKHAVSLRMERTDAAGVGLITSKTVDESYFVRAAISLCEVDETIKPTENVTSDKLGPVNLKYSIEISRKS